MEVITFSKLIADVMKYNPSEIEMVTKAYRYAEKNHLHQKRASDEDYITHPLAVAYTLSEMHADRNTLCAALLHDVIEEADVTKEDLQREFNEDVANLVDGVSKIDEITFASKREKRDANIRKLVTSMKEDPRILIIKLADRLHNMRTLHYKEEIKQKEKALETMEIYVPLAHYIGAFRLKCELEDLSLFYLKNDTYREVKNKINLAKEKNEEHLYEMVINLLQVLAKENIERDIKIRTKNIYSVYKELEEGQGIDDIHDLLALKIMVADIKNCYHSLGLVHNEYPPLNHHFKDYIALPKTNMYQSLHTTVFSPQERLVQAQIRTFAMDKIASFGLTAYWDINKGAAKKVMQEDLREKSQFFQALNELNATIVDNREFVDQAQAELFAENVYVYTSAGDIIQLPSGATPIDFAYKIGAEEGNNMILAIVNGQEVSFDYQLQNNDRVKIVTDKITEGPSQTWLDQAKTTSAKVKIKEYNKRNLRLQRKGVKMDTTNDD